MREPPDVEISLRADSGLAPSQWETSLQSNDVSHWLGAKKPRISPGSHWIIHWGRLTHICVDKLTIIGSDNGLSPGRRQAIIWTNAGILLIGPLRTNFREILIEIYKFPFKKMYLKMSSGKSRPFCLGLNELRLFSHGQKWQMADEPLCVRYLAGTHNS